MSQEPKISLGFVVRNTHRIITTHAATIVPLAVLLSVLPSLILDSQMDGVRQGRGALLAVSAVNLIGSGLLTAAITQLVLDDAMERTGPLVHYFRRLSKLALPVVGLLIVTGIGMGLGFALLIIPGILLTLRWFLAVPALVAGEPGISASMTASRWLMTGNYTRGLAVLVTPYAVFALATIILVLIEKAAGIDQNGLPATMAEDVLASAASTVVAVATAVTYVGLRQLKDGVTPRDVAATFD